MEQVKGAGSQTEEESTESRSTFKIKDRRQTKHCVFCIAFKICFSLKHIKWKKSNVNNLKLIME